MFYAHHPAPSQDLNEHVTVYPDGTTVKYHFQTGQLTLQGARQGALQFSNALKINCPNNQITGNVVIEGNLIVKGQPSYFGGMSGEPAQGQTHAATIKGSIQHEKGHIVSNGVQLDTHSHINAHGRLTGKSQNG